MNPSVLIISLNPGGGPPNFVKDKRNYESGNFSSSDSVPYSGSNRFSEAVKNMFSNQLPLFQTGTTAIFVSFLRSKHFNSVSGERVRQMQPVCHKTVTEIVETLEPKRFLIFSFDANKETRKILGKADFTGRTVTVKRERKPTSDLVKEYNFNSRWGLVPVLARIHPTPKFDAPTTDEKKWMRKRFDSWLSNT